jgi:putative spermidine/putrescine transport system substrate-binding protein
MFNRRSFLTAATTLILSAVMAGCQPEGNLRVLLLQASIPVQLIAAFRKEFNQARKLVFKPESQLEDLFKLLQTWQGKTNHQAEKSQFTLPTLSFKSTTPVISNLVTLGDYWLTEAIKQQLIEPLTVENIPNWNQLPSRFAELVTRNNQGLLDGQGNVWGAPYRWGCTMIAYRVDEFNKLGWQPTDWSDLWRKELGDRFSLLNHPREVIGLTLKKLGYSYNTSDLSNISQLKSDLIALNKQVKFYDSTNYLQPLILGDTWLAVGWSSDILPIVKRYANIESVIPVSGTSLWADLWVKPKNNQGSNPEVINNWINFCWQPKSAKQISLFTNAASPMLFSLNKSELSQDIVNNALIYPPSDVMNKSDFILPLAEGVVHKYQQLWQEIRQT